MSLSIAEIIAKAGGVNLLARKLGVTPGAVSQWDKVPLGRLARVAEITGIPASHLRPDQQGFSETQAPFGEALALGLDAKAIAAAAVTEAVRAEKTRRWREENAAAMEAKAAWLEEHGLPLAEYRQF